VPLWGGGAGFPSNTIWPGTRPTCMPSFILIRPTVWPQCTNVTDRTDRTDRQTDNGPIAYRGNRFINGGPKIVWRLSQENPSVGGVNSRGVPVAKYSDFGPIEGYISETVQDTK